MDRIVVSTSDTPPVDPGPAESSTSGLYEYSFNAGDLVASGTGTDNLLIATVTNGLDETSGPSAVYTVTYDNAAPAQPGQPDLTAAHDMGYDDTDDLTNKSDPTITGTAKAAGSDTAWRPLR